VTPAVHTAVVVGSDEGLVEVVTAFVRDGLAAGEAVGVAVRPETWERLVAEVGPSARVTRLGSPAELTRAAVTLARYRRFTEQMLAFGASAVRVVGEAAPPTDGTRRSRWAECEAVLTPVMARSAFRGLCAYDERLVPPGLLAACRRTHGVVRDGLGRNLPGGETLPQHPVGQHAPSHPPTHAPLVDLEVTDLSDLRAAVRAAVGAVTVPDRATEQFLLSVHEVAVDGSRHGVPPVTVRLLADPPRLWCTITDHGPGIDDPYVGYARGTWTAPRGASGSGWPARCATRWAGPGRRRASPSTSDST
jgi:anti-sigma regulatory factor (Ser/Thr protein kinase)